MAETGTSPEAPPSPSGSPSGAEAHAAAPARPSVGGDRLAGTSLAAWMVLLLVAGSTLWADLWTKSWAFRTVAGRPVEVVRDEVLAIAKVDPLQIGRVIPPHNPQVVMEHVLQFSLVLNSGAVFGMGPGQRWFFMTFTFAAIAFAIFMFARWCRARDWLSHAAIGMLISGGIGNFYDRMVYGCVRDFIHPLPEVKFPFGWAPFGGGGQVWPYVSNVADAFLLIGIGILAWRLWKFEASGPKPGASTAAGTSSPATS